MEEWIATKVLKEDGLMYVSCPDDFPSYLDSRTPTDPFGRRKNDGLLYLN